MAIPYSPTAVPVVDRGGTAHISRTAWLRRRSREDLIPFMTWVHEPKGNTGWQGARVHDFRRHRKGSIIRGLGASEGAPAMSVTGATSDKAM